MNAIMCALRETVKGDGVCEKDGKVLFVHEMLAGESVYLLPYSAFFR